MVPTDSPKALNWKQKKIMKLITMLNYTGLHFAKASVEFRNLT